MLIEAVQFILVSLTENNGTSVPLFVTFVDTGLAAMISFYRSTLKMNFGNTF